MSPALLFPLGLAALAALLLPLLVHLARRTEQQPLEFAALRWLRQKPRPRHRPRFDELLLLAVRLLLLAMIALLLAEPVLRDAVDDRPVVAVAPGARVPTDTGARRVWLAPGFPPVEAAMPRGALPIGSLIRQLDAELPPRAPLTLVVPERLEGADAERPRLSRRVTWQVTPGAMPVPSVRVTPPRFALRSAGSTRGAAYMRAAAGALRMASFDDGTADRPVPAGTPALIWLAGGALPDRIKTWVEAGGTLLVAHDAVLPAAAMTSLWRDEDGRIIVEGRAIGQGRLLRFTRSLTPAAMPELLEPTFPGQLADLLRGAAPAPARVTAAAYRPSFGADAGPSHVRDLAPWIVAVIALVWLVERWLATRARRAVAP